MRCETKTCDRRDFSIIPGDPKRWTIDPGRLIVGPFAPMKPRASRLLYISDEPPLNLPHYPRIISETEPGDRRRISTSYATGRRSWPTESVAIRPTRETFPATCVHFRRPPPPINPAVAKSTRSETESGDRPDIARPPEDPKRLTIDPGHLIMGHSPRSRLVFA